jgi:pilus assembly protein FimV
MNLRLSSLRAMFMHRDISRLAAAAALTFALADAGLGTAAAAPAAAAGASDAASVAYTAGSQYTVRSGQSLNDVAIAVTQSHDKATLARAAHALFDANPNAFMSHDPSRMRVGALLLVPVLDASGALAASSASAQAAAAAPASSQATATAPAPNVAATASDVAQGNVAAASAASAAARGAAPAVLATASAATEAASAVQGGAAAGGAISSAPIADSQAGASPASDAHEWAGSIQPPASQPVEGTQAPATGTAPAKAAALPASQPRAQVSSLQQLLALKNRVLMELQKHGIGGAPAVTGTVPTNGAQPVAGASVAASAASVPGPGTAAIPTSTNGGMSQLEWSIAAAVGAALVVLLAALRMRRRKSDGVASAEDASADRETAARASEPQGVVATREEVPGHDVLDANDDVAIRHAAALSATQRETAEDNTAQQEAASREAEIHRAAMQAEEQATQHAAAQRLAAEQAEAERAALEQADTERAADEQASSERSSAEHAAVERAAAEHAEAEQTAAEHAATKHAEAEQTAAEHPATEPTLAERSAAQTIAEQAAAEHEATAHSQHAASPAQSVDPSEEDQHEPRLTSAPAEPVSPHLDTNVLAPTDTSLTAEPLHAPHQENFDGATTAASLAAAAELGAEALPLTPLEPVDETSSQGDDELPQSLPSALEQPSAEPQNQLNAPSPVIDLPQQHAEPHTLAPSAPSYLDLPELPVPPVMPAPVAPNEFPRDAVDAFSGLDMPLPPRIESTADDITAASPATTAQQAVAPHDPDDVPHIADEINAGTAGHAAVAGLGAAGFGALNLDFDLELPPSPAQPLAAFTKADLVRIARNKLDLASEYIELGDLSGARTLINEVIEANDPATRTEARALLSTLAPLS